MNVPIEPTVSLFTPLLETTFRVTDGLPSPIDIVLVEAVDKGSVPSQAQFSLVFRGPAATPLDQGSYPVEHDTLGAFEIFLSPIGKERDSVLYEAFFNILR